MKRLAFRLSIALLTFFFGISAAALYLYHSIPPLERLDEPTVLPCPERLYMHLSAESTTFRVGENPKIHLTVTNVGDDQVTLVQPGDGSAHGRRTPIISWSVLNENDVRKHPSEPVPLKSLRCGYITPLAPGEVFTLVPGETKELKGIEPYHSFDRPGVYRVVFLYANVPAQEWKGESPESHDTHEMWRVRHSTGCTLKSNEVVFTVRI